MLLLKERELVVPGETIARGLDYVPGNNTYRYNNEIVASIFGFITIEGKVIKIIPLNGVYFPRKDDNVIGRITDIMPNGFKVDINSAYSAFLLTKELSQRTLTSLTVGDYIYAKITNIKFPNLIDLTLKGPEYKKLGEGRIIRVRFTKVPRIIGTKASMINLIKKYTNCKILIGQNGILWIKGNPKQEILAEKAIRIIEKYAHKKGLTDRIKKFLEQNEL